jgi:hypothetical protein
VAAGETLFPIEESDVRTVAPDREDAGNVAAGRQGTDLTGWVLGGFLLLLVAEFILAREPWAGRRRGTAK